MSKITNLLLFEVLHFEFNCKESFENQKFQKLMKLFTMNKKSQYINITDSPLC